VVVTDALAQVEGMRREEVERLQQAQVLLRGEQEQARQAHHVALLERSRAEGALLEARSTFASAASVTALRSAEQHIELAQAAVTRALSACALTTRHCRRCDVAVRTGEAAIRAAELSRRAVARTREQRAHDVSVRVERRREDEADDAFRATRRAATQRAEPPS